jgi:dipeptidyl aminopeptidase/acylaminoacyl peptidase
LPSWSPLSRALAAVALLPALALAAPPAVKPAARPSKQYSIEQLMETMQLSGVAFSSDEKKVLFSSNLPGTFNVFSAPVGGGKPTALTRSAKESHFLVSAFPQDGRVLFRRDQSGNELTHLYVLTPDGKERDLTPGDKLRAQFVGWSKDGAAFYVLSNERDERFMDLYRYDAKTYARTRLYQNDGGHDVRAVSPDEKWIALGKARTTADSDVWLHQVGTQEPKHLTAHQGIAQYSVAGFDPASGALYVLTNDGSEFTRVVRYTPPAWKLEEVEKADWDITSTAFSRTGAYRVTTLNEDGRTAVRLHDTKAGTQVALPKLPEGTIDSVVISRSEKRMAFFHDGDRSPQSLYVYELAAKKATRLTDNLNPQVDPEDLVDSQKVSFKSFDGLEIPSILYKPHQATPENKAPALVFVPGGPGGQSYRGYISFVQYLVNHGYVVLGVNHRGSSGYGKAFFTADDQKHGKEPLRDCLEARKYLASLPYVDGSRVGIIGASYGGYVTLAALAFHPEAFAVGVDAFGVSNWLRSLKDMPPHWESFREALYQEIGDPVKQEAMLREISPLFHAERIRKPLLVLQGANDPRVLKSETDALVEAVKKSQVPVEYIVLADEGHGFSNKKNEAESSARILGFLEKYLRN